MNLHNATRLLAALAFAAPMMSPGRQRRDRNDLLRSRGRAPGRKPGGTISQQMTATVTVNDIDTKVPSVTITTEDGQKVSFKVENPKNLEGVKAGDAMTRILRPAVLQPRLPLGASGTC